MTVQAELVVATDHFDADLATLTDELGFRIELIRPADAPRLALLSGHGLTLRLERAGRSRPVTIDLVTDVPGRAPIQLPGGTTFGTRSATRTVVVPDNRPELLVVRAVDASAGSDGRAGMHYRDLLPGGWGGRFESSLISIPDGGPVADYVHFHRIRFQMITVKSGWVRVVYEDQGEPFVMQAGDCVLQPPEIRHRVLEASPGLEVVEIGCPAEHDTIADWSLDLPTSEVRPERSFGGQRFLRHVAAESSYGPWRQPGWEARDTGIGAATEGLAGALQARPLVEDETGSDPWMEADTEFAQLVVLAGSVVFEADGEPPVRLADGDAVAVPGGVRHRLRSPTEDCVLLDVTLPAVPHGRR
ncbi:MAG: cupin domain-containing protein [Ilumatobacter sp.]|nr:cupin domain-containing protein [Ilumatobacter sp.]